MRQPLSAAPLVLALCLAAPSVCVAQRDPVTLPACAAANVDATLLTELVAIELGTALVSIELDAAVCEPSARLLGFVARDLVERITARDAITLAPGDDVHARTRVLALALVERARLALATASRMRAAPRRAPPVASPEPTGHGDAPRGELGVALAGRFAPLSGAWLLGARVELGALFEHTWILRAALASAWSRGTTVEGDVDAVVAALGLTVGVVLARSESFDAALLVRGEIGLVHASGTLRGGGAARSITGPWSTLGLALEGAWWIDRGWAITGMLAGDGVLAGLEISERSGTSIALSYVVLELTLGVRLAL